MPVIIYLNVDQEYTEEQLGVIMGEPIIGLGKFDEMFCGMQYEKYTAADFAIAFNNGDISDQGNILFIK